MKLYDLCEMYWNGVTVRHIATPHTNLPFTICRAKKRIYEGNRNITSYQANHELPKGTFYMIVDNGKKPLDVLLKRFIVCEDCGLRYPKKYKECPSSACSNMRLEEQAREEYEEDQLLQSFEEGLEEN